MSQTITITNAGLQEILDENRKKMMDEIKRKMRKYPRDNDEKILDIVESSFIDLRDDIVNHKIPEPHYPFCQCLDCQEFPATNV